MGLGGGLFIRSGSVVNPFLVGRLTMMPTPESDLWNTVDNFPVMSNKITVLKREEGIGRPLGLRNLWQRN